eukprot:Gb_04752 [translate_table: standard]
MIVNDKGQNWHFQLDPILWAYLLASVHLQGQRLIL